MTCHSWIAESTIWNPKQMARKLDIYIFLAFIAYYFWNEDKIYAILSFKM